MDAPASTGSAAKMFAGAAAAAGVIALSGLGDNAQSFVVQPSAGSAARSLRARSGATGIATPETSGSSSASWCVGGGVSILALSALGGSRRKATGGRRVQAVQRQAAFEELSTGSKVLWNGKEGTVSYTGPTDYAKGQWVGVALDTDAGMHDGTVLGKSYFDCAPKHGIFAQAAQLTLVGASPAPAAPAVSAPASAPAPAASPSASSTLSVGARVNWRGKAGTVSFIGATKFASGEWVGVTLDSAEGVHDGSVLGHSYFECPSKCGVFAQAADLGGSAAAAAPAAPAAAPAPAAAAPAAAAPAAAGLAVGSKVSWNGKEGVVSFIGKTTFAAGEWVGVTLNTPDGMHDGSVMGHTYFQCAAKCGIFTDAAKLQAVGQAAPQLVAA